MLYFWHFSKKNFFSQSKKPSLHWKNSEHAFMSDFFSRHHIECSCEVTFRSSYILGVLTQTTAWEKHYWGGEKHCSEF